MGIIFNLSLSLTSYSDHKVLAVFLSRIFLISLFLSISTTTGIVVKNLPASAGDVRDAGSILGLGRPSRVGNGNLLQHSCLENSMGRGAWQAIVHGVKKVTATCPHSLNTTEHTDTHTYHQGYYSSLTDTINTSCNRLVCLLPCSTPIYSSYCTQNDLSKL